MISSILEKVTKPAFVIGNGVHRYADREPFASSWESLVKKLEDLVDCSLPDLKSNHATGADLSLTERYDMVRLKASVTEVRRKVELEAVGLFKNLGDRKPNDHIHAVTRLARNREIPILTTNFDLALSNGSGAYAFQKFQAPFSQHYPWNSCLIQREKDFGDPFAHRIWHVHGSIQYEKSIRFGLRDYMGAVSKARNLIHNGEDNLYRGKDTTCWAGYQTWLHPFFNCDLIIFGLGLNSQEVFLRWLLLERAGYSIKFPDRKRKLFFIEKQSQLSAQKRAFIKAVGGEVVALSDYPSLYESFLAA